MQFDYYNEILIKCGEISENDKIIRTKKLAGGFNSSVQLVETANKKFVLKKYPNDLSPSRLEVEYNFLTWANSIGIKNIPKALTRDDQNTIGVYSYIEGKNLKEITPICIEACVDFIGRLNAVGNKQFLKIQNANDCFFSCEDLLLNIEGRFAKLSKYQNDHDIQYTNTLNYFHEIFLQLSCELNENMSEMDAYLHSMGTIISPSDFGAHNIIENNAGFFFLDFEYAGIDSALKLICDFACQPRVTVRQAELNSFIDKLNQRLVQNPDVYEIIFKFIPLFRLKWSLIIMGMVNKADLCSFGAVSQNKSQLVKSKNYWLKSVRK